MNTEKLIKALKKELTRNPKKTVALGLVSVVALWFWVPLASKWIGGGKAKPKAKAVAAEPATATPTVAAPSTPTPAPTTVTPSQPTATIAWDDLLGRMARDERMQTAAQSRGGRDPFAITAAEQETVAASLAEESKADAPARIVHSDPSPAELGLVLQGTLVSSRVHRATISGRTYGIGDTIKVRPQANTTAGNSLAGWEFTLNAVDSRQVVLMRNDKPYELKLVRETLAEGDQVTYDPHSQAH